jgi:hypothetical protein
MLLIKESKFKETANLEERSMACIHLHHITDHACLMHLSHVQLKDSNILNVINLLSEDL